MINTTGAERQELRDKVSELNQRVKALESGGSMPAPAAPTAAAEEPAGGSGVTEDGVPYEYLFDQTGGVNARCFISLPIRSLATKYTAVTLIPFDPFGFLCSVMQADTREAYQSAAPLNPR